MVLSGSGKIYSYTPSDYSVAVSEMKTYEIHEITPTELVLYTIFSTTGVLHQLSENLDGDGLLGIFTEGYLGRGGGICGGSEFCGDDEEGCGGGCSDVQSTVPLYEEVKLISATEQKRLIRHEHRSIVSRVDSLMGSETGMICYNGNQGFGCYYADNSSPIEYTYRSVSDVPSSYFAIATKDKQLVQVVRGTRDYPQLIDHPGQANEVRGLLLTDANIPVKGTITFTTTGGDFTAYKTGYSYDAIGRIKAISENRYGTTSEHRYVYNDVGKLIEATTDGTTQTWQYDANGNRTHEDGIKVAEYDAQDRLTKYKGNTYQYNALGQLAQKTSSSGADSFNYDVFGNLRGVGLANGDNIEYLIDPKNRRIGKKKNGQVVQKFVYQDQLNPLAELYPDNSVKNLFIYAEKSNVPSQRRGALRRQR